MQPAKVYTLIICLAFLLPSNPTSSLAATTGVDNLDKGDVSAESSDDVTEDNIKKLISEADSLLDAQDLTGAISAYKKAIDFLAKNEDDKKLLVHCYKKTGVAYTLQQDYDNAIQNLKKALSTVDEEESKMEDKALNKVLVLYSLARAYQSKQNYDKALSTCQSALELAKSNLSDSPYIIRRLISLKSELYLAHVSEKLDQEQEKPKHPAQFHIAKSEDAGVAQQPEQQSKPLVGGVSTRDYFRSSGLLSEVPNLDTSHMKSVPLKAKTNQTKLFAGTSKVKNKLTKKLLEYGTMGLSLRKEVPGFPWYVKYLLTGGAAERYGVREKDLVDSVDGHPIVSLPITTIYHMLCGRVGDVRTLGITRNGKKMYVRVQLINVYEIGNVPSEYTEYYWFLLYNGYINNQQYARLAKPLEKYWH